MLADAELARLLEACHLVQRTENRYIASDFVAALLDTVLDYQMHNRAVVNANKHFNKHRWGEVRTLDDLKRILARFPDDRQGNTALAQYLWGYRLWTRAAQLRGLVAYFEELGITTIEGLRSWATASSFNDFQGRVRGLGPAVYQWLVMRLGRATVKPDVHILRFVGRAIGRPVSEREAVEGLEWVARKLDMPANELDWSIWEHEREARS